MTRTAATALSDGLDELRRSGAVTELLFLYECATAEPTQLRPVADRLHVTVQAVSHVFRQLRKRGLVEAVEGRYRPTVKGVAWLHETFGHISEDIAARLAHLHVIRSTRAIAGESLSAGAAVTLELVGGLLTATRGARGPSRGRVRTAAHPGALVEVTDLEGIVAVHPTPVRIRTLSEADLTDSETPVRLRGALGAESGLVAAMGLEAYALLSEAKVTPVERFAVAEVGRDAARIGVPVQIVVSERDLPRLLADFSKSTPPSLEVSPLWVRPGRAGNARVRRA